ncbi:MAG: hypothetical protein ACTSPB_00060 [Candidatus Thorarchaeota archaeon]
MGEKKVTTEKLHDYYCQSCGGNEFWIVVERWYKGCNSKVIHVSVCKECGCRGRLDLR